MWEGGLGPFLPSLGTYMAQEWSKIWLFLGQNQATMAGWFQGGDPAWKVFSVPYHTPMYGTTLFRPTFALSRHQSRVPGVQNMAGCVPGEGKSVPKPCPLMYLDVIWHTKHFPAGIPTLEPARHSGLILTQKIAIFWTPGTLDWCLERAKVGLNNVVPCIGV